MRDRILRCLAFSKITREELRQNVELTCALGKIASMVDVIYIDNGFQTFRKLFDEVRAEFLTSTEYGLDSNLSQRIRHGTLAGEIRAQFEDFKFVTLKDTSGEYGENGYWLEKLKPPTTDLCTEISDILAQFSRDVDQTIFVVRSEWIQIQSDTVPNGMFDYNFSDLQLERVLKISFCYLRVVLT